VNRRGKKSQHVTGSRAVVVDEARDGSAPMASGGLGGSGMRADFVTEGQFILPPPLAFVTSPFGDRYLASKSKPMTKLDVIARLQCWAFDVTGFQDYGTVTLNLPGATDAQQCLNDWYVHARDMGKRSIKYKHLPTGTNVKLIPFMNTWYWVVANCATLLNMSRLSMYNKAFADLNAWLPKYVGRIMKIWAKAGTMPMPPLLKAHAIRNGQVVGFRDVIAPTVRVWGTQYVPKAGAPLYGPAIVAMETRLDNMFITDVLMESFVSSLEIALRWLVSPGFADPTTYDAYVAMKDAIDMMCDIVPGSFTQGLPDPKTLPGLSQDLTVLTDQIARCWFLKDIINAGTDQWQMFPCPEFTGLGSKIPIIGFGTPNPLYDFTVLGSPKFGVFNSGLSVTRVDVDTDVRVFGTDFRNGMIGPCNPTANSEVVDVRAMWGQKSGYIDEELLTETGLVTPDQMDAFRWDTAATILAWIAKDPTRVRHLWFNASSEIKGTLTAKFIDEVRASYKFFAPGLDLCNNYALTWYTQLGIPYMRSGA
jgi:hypothetical protein